MYFNWDNKVSADFDVMVSEITHALYSAVSWSRSNCVYERLKNKRGLQPLDLRDTIESVFSFYFYKGQGKHFGPMKAVIYVF